MSEVRLVNLVKKYDKTVAVDNLSLDVSSGEFVVLLGPSGCGKTTTLRCISGLENPDQGEILIDGTLVNGLPPKDRDVAMVFQNYALYPHMTVFENIAYPLKMRKLPKGKIEEQVRQAAGLLNILQLLSRRPRQLSGGEQQRVALGRALVRRPRVFLMDEPLSNLDAKLRLYTRAELKKLQGDLKVTTIYVTHDQAEAMALADRVAVMNNGKILQYDSPDKIYGKPSSMFVAGFIGTPPMNLIRTTVLKKDGVLTLDAGIFVHSLTSDMSEYVEHNLSDSEVFLGVRAEDLQISPKRSAESVFQAEISVLELLGATVMVDLKVGDYLLRSVIPSPTDLKQGINIWVSFATNKIHLFDAKTEKAIL